MFYQELKTTRATHSLFSFLIKHSSSFFNYYWKSDIGEKLLKQIKREMWTGVNTSQLFKHGKIMCTIPVPQMHNDKILLT